MRDDMTFDLERLAALSAVPEKLSDASAWLGHIPFARWLVDATKPRLFVELGVHRGDSYCAMCESIQAAGLSTRAFGVDSWLGDHHAGPYSEEIYSDLKVYHDPRYGAFSTLVRLPFDEASNSFDAKSIDLLHIDGCHTYDAVRSDFETWAPKMSPQGVVLFHDTQVKRNDFGVWKYWSEVRKTYPSFEFHHSSGLGVLCSGEDPPIALSRLTGLDGSEATQFRALFTALGDHIQFRQLVAQVDRMERSLSWRITKPLRRISSEGPLYRFATSIRDWLNN
jgi:O-antigen biosynthesis protein